MKKSLFTAAVILIVTLSLLVPASAQSWTKDYRGTNLFPETMKSDDQACYVDGFACFYDKDAAGDHFKYEGGKLTSLDDGVVRYNWFIVFEPDGDKVYKASYAGNNILAGATAVTMSEKGMMLVFNYWEGDGRVANKPFYEAYLYTLGEATAKDLYNDVAAVSNGLWLTLDTELKIADLFDAKPNGGTSVSGNDSSEASGETGSEVTSEAVSEASSEASAESSAPAESAAASSSDTSSAAASSAASTEASASSDDGGMPAWVWVVVGVAAAAAIAVAIVALKKRK